MKKVEGNLFDYAENGYIVHQVNCQNAMGSGFAKEFFTRYPIIKEEYHKECDKFIKEDKALLGHLQILELDGESKLYGVNSFTQEFYGNSYKNKRKYTNEEFLINNIGEVLKVAKTKDLPTYIPEKIGCGLGGGDWETILEGLEQFDHGDLVIVKFSSKKSSSQINNENTLFSL